MMMCIQHLVLFGQFVLKILSKNQILTSIKGRNSVANLRKTKMYNTNLDLVTDNVYTNGLKILSKNHILMSIFVYGDFFRRPRAANSAVLGPIWPNFELVRDVMDVLITCKYEEDPIKNIGARVFTTLYVNFSDAQGQITLESVVVSGRNSNSSKLLRMSLLPSRMRMIDSKMKELECSQDFSHYKSMGIFPDAQGQLTPQSFVRSGRISNSSEMFWMFSFPASMKKIRSKMKAPERSQHFPIITLWELSVAMDTRLPIRSGPKPNAAFPLPQ